MLNFIGGLLLGALIMRVIDVKIVKDECNKFRREHDDDMNRRLDRVNEDLTNMIKKLEDRKGGKK